MARLENRGGLIESVMRPFSANYGGSRFLVNNILMIGNFFSGSSFISGVCEDLALQLQSANWGVITTSSKVSRINRLQDIVNKIWTYRHDYSLAQVDVFSGKAFVVPEIACFILQKLQKPYILTLHGGGLPDFSERWPNRVRRLLNSAAAVTVPSRYLLQTMAKYRHDLCLIPNGIDLKPYRFRKRDSLEPKLIWVRAFSKIYNPVLALKTVGIVKNKIPNVTLTLIGPDKGDGTFKSVSHVSKTLGLSLFTRILGPVPHSEIPFWLDQHDIFLNTTNVDNTPLSLLEALACGLCSVNTNVGGLPYLLKHDENSLLVPPNDPEEMAAGVLRLLNDTVLSKKISSLGRSLAESHSWEVVLPQWDSLFSSILASNK